MLSVALTVVGQRHGGVHHQMQSEAIRANQRQSEAIRGHQSEAIRCRAVPWGVEDHHALEGSPADISLVHRVCGRVQDAVVGVYMAPSAVLDARVGAHLWGKSGGAVVGTCMQGRGRVSELTENLLYGQMSPMDA